MEESAFNAELASLQQRQAELDADKEKLTQKAIDKCRELIAICGLTEEQLFPKVRRKGGAPARARIPKYRNPFGSEEWTGGGKHPKWFDDAIRKGVSVSDMLITTQTN